ncbi:MAG: nuclear transport factor 2 family protein [Ancalomicrobiaceae bacterium]|nr:nuclear transport factor 2 family protein [Ancalomicrobiaceae bacterium]
MLTTRSGRLALYILSAATVLFGAPSTGSAQDADVKTAIDASQAAIHSLNIGEIAKIWSHGADVTLVNPLDKTVAVGWDAVKGRWEAVFAFVSGVDIKQTDGPYITVTDNIARAVGIVHVTVHFKAQDPKESNYVETDVLQKQDGHWLVVSHTAKPI